MASFKPTFTISDKQILWNLHKASFTKLQKNYPKVVEITNDGAKVDPAEVRASTGFEIRGFRNDAIGKEAKSSFGKKDFTYEATVVYKFYVSLTSTAKGTIAEPSATDIANAKKEALKVMQEYFTVFCGSDLAKKIKEADLQEGKSNDEGFKGFSVTYTVGAKAK